MNRLNEIEHLKLPDGRTVIEKIRKHNTKIIMNILRMEHEKNDIERDNKRIINRIGSFFGDSKGREKIKTIDDSIMQKKSEKLKEGEEGYFGTYQPLMYKSFYKTLKEPLVELIETREGLDLVNKNGEIRKKLLKKEQEIIKKFGIENLQFFIKDPDLFGNIKSNILKYLELNVYDSDSSLQEKIAKIIVDNIEIIKKLIVNVEKNGEHYYNDDYLKLINIALTRLSENDLKDMTKQYYNQINDLVLYEFDNKPIYGILNDFVVRYMIENYPQFKDSVIKYLEKLFEKKDFKKISLICKSKNKFVQEIAIKKLDDYLVKDFDISLNDIGYSWNIKTLEDESNRDIELNIPTMNNLESKKKGIVRYLLKKYGIREFSRYPEEALISQIDNENTNQPYGVIFFPRSDHNNAFNQDKEYILKLYNQAKDNNFGIKIVEIGNSIELIQYLKRFDKKYGNMNKISFGILGGHGSGHSIDLGIDKNFLGYLDIEKLNNINQALLEKIEKYFISNASIVLVSCHSGIDNGIGKNMSGKFLFNINGPTEATNLKDIELKFNTKQQPILKAQFSGNSKEYSKGVEVKSSD